MRLVLVVAVCACHSSVPPAQYAPLPPDQPSAAPPAPAPPTAPQLAAIPASHPTGDPIVIHVAPPKVGDIENHTLASTFVEHGTFTGESTTRYQKTERRFELRIRTLEVTGDHPSRIEVAVAVASEIVALGDTEATAKRDEETLLAGTYIVTPGPGHGFERDEAFVSRSDGTKVFGREQEELGALLGESLRSSSPIPRYLANHPMRLGDAIALDDAAKRELVGQDPIPGTFTLALVKTDGKTATYQLDVTGTSIANAVQNETRLQSFAVVELATGRELDQRDTNHRIERSQSGVDDTVSNSSHSVSFPN